MKHTMNTQLARWVIFAVLVLFLASLALPYFAYGAEGESVSLLSYLSLPGNHGEAEAWIGTQVAGYEINDLAGPHVILFCGVIVAAILLVAMKGSIVSIAAGGAVGVWGVIAYSVNSILRLGGWARTVQMLLLAAAALVGIAAVVSAVLARRKESEAAVMGRSGEQVMAS